MCTFYAEREEFEETKFEVEMEMNTSQQPSQENDKNDDAFVKVEQSGVKRKLFQEDGTENNEGFQEYEAADTCGQSSQNWEKDAKVNDRRENKIFSKEKKGVRLFCFNEVFCSWLVR